MAQHLVIAAFWTEETPDDATDRVAEHLVGPGIKGSGAVVAIHEDTVDPPLRRFLRNVQIQEAANHIASERKDGDG